MPCAAVYGLRVLGKEYYTGTMVLILILYQSRFTSLSPLWNSEATDRSRPNGAAAVPRRLQQNAHDGRA